MRGAGDLLLLQGLQQRGFVDDRPARGVDEIAGRLHAREIGGADQAARALAQHHMDGDDVGGREQFFLAGIADADLLASLRRQVRAPGDHVHAERLRQPRDLGCRACRGRPRRASCPRSRCRRISARARRHACGRSRGRYCGSVPGSGPSSAARWDRGPIACRTPPPRGPWRPPCRSRRCACPR